MARGLVAFAARPTASTFGRIRLAPEVSLAIGAKTVTTKASTRMRDVGEWLVGSRDELFEGGTGPFSALAVLRGSGAVDVGFGAHSKCANPPTPAPSEAAGLRQLSFQPRYVDSCIYWYAVDVYLDAAGRVRVVRVDFYEP